MNVNEIMTKNVACALPNTSLQQVAQMMIDCDCGAIPVCESQDNMLIGIVTDRDIVCRALAQGQNPLQITVQEVMTKDLHTLTFDASVDECIQLMQQYQVRRVPITDQRGKLVGIVSEADIATKAMPQSVEVTEEFDEALEEIYQPKAHV